MRADDGVHSPIFDNSIFDLQSEETVVKSCIICCFGKLASGTKYVQRSNLRFVVALCRSDPAGFYLATSPRTSIICEGGRGCLKGCRRTCKSGPPPKSL